jgi:dimethylhistidine N-methyltransferase
MRTSRLPPPLATLRTPAGFLAQDELLVDRLTQDPAADRRALIAGLRATPARIPPKYFYDGLGCALYAAICELPEYYPTRTERAIFAQNRMAIAAAIGRGKQFVDLGAGDCGKAATWLPYLAPSRYLAVDIAAEELARSLAILSVEFPEIDVVGIVTDFTHGLDLRADLTADPVTFFYPGSSIGNFTREEAGEFLSAIYAHCAQREGSGLLIGVDTRKDVARLTAAYADALGVTAAFNRNVLNHINRILHTDFAPQAFAHVAVYDDVVGRIEMHLEARMAQTVMIDGEPRHFAQGERIHTENSYKYAPREFELLLRTVGFTRVTCWQDPAGDFAVFYAE